MTLPVSGNPISMSQVNTELGLTSTAQISFNDSAVRTLFGIASGAIDLNSGHGKSNRVTINRTASSNTIGYILNATQAGYVAGMTDITLTINSGVYIYNVSTTAALTISGFTAGDTVTVINNGYILGFGGAGASAGSNVPGNGSTAISLGFNTTIVNNGYIGGGGGGGSAAGSGSCGGGGGAGGGNGGSGRFTTGSIILIAGGLGSLTPGSAGSNGGTNTNAYGGCASGGGGGLVVPGTGGSGGNPTLVNSVYVGAGSGGGGGGGGGAANSSGGAGGAGGGAGSAGSAATVSFPYNFAGGGGGWGASGGAGATSPTVAGGNGGKAIALNGYTATQSGSGTTYGAVA